MIMHFQVQFDIITQGKKNKGINTPSTKIAPRSHVMTIFMTHTKVWVTCDPDTQTPAMTGLMVHDACACLYSIIPNLCKPARVASRADPSLKTFTLFASVRSTTVDPNWQASINPPSYTAVHMPQRSLKSEILVLDGWPLRLALVNARAPPWAAHTDCTKADAGTLTPGTKMRGLRQNNNFFHNHAVV